MRAALFVGVASLLILAAAGSGAEEVIAGPVEAKVLKVIDGDTVRVRARIWLGQDVETNVRLDGVDTPEVHARCDGERDAAARARDFLKTRVTEGETVQLRGITHGKYAGRVVAAISNERGEDLSQLLLKAGIARPYGGGTRNPWCS